MNVFWKRFFRSEWFLLVAWMGLFLSVFIIVRIAANVMLYQSIKRARSSGVELDYKKFIPPQISPKENASYVIEDAVNAILDYNDSLLSESDPYAAKIQEIVDRNGPFQFSPENDLEIFRDAVRPYKVGLDLLFENRHLERARFDTNYEADNLSDIDIPNFPQRMNIAAILYAKALVACYDGEIEKAYDTVGVLFRFSHWCFQETPSWVSSIIGYSVAHLGFGALHCLMQSSAPTQSQRTSLLREIERIQKYSFLDFGFRFESMSQYKSSSHLFANYMMDDSKPQQSHSPFENYLSWLLMGWYGIATQSANLDYSVSLLKDIERTAIERTESSNAFLKIPSWAFLLRISHRNDQSILLRRDILRTLCDFALLSFALLDFYEDQNQFPSGLDAIKDRLNGAGIVDPFSFENYRYQKTENGVFIYSPGPDFDDDEGKMGVNYALDSYDGDLAWTVTYKKTDSNG